MTTDYSISYGNKYNRDLDVAEIAKLVRGDIKAGVKSGELPKGLKVSVRVSRFAGGCSLRACIVAVPGLQIMNPARLAHDLDHPHRYPEGLNLHSEAARALQGQLEQLIAAYNFDGSDTMTDYFHVNFYGSVDFDWHAEKAEREAFKAARAVSEVA